MFMQETDRERTGQENQDLSYAVRTSFSSCVNLFDALETW